MLYSLPTYVNTQMPSFRAARRRTFWKPQARRVGSRSTPPAFSYAEASPASTSLLRRDMMRDIAALLMMRCGFLYY